MIEIWRPQVASTEHSRDAYDSIYAGKGIRLPDSFYLWLLTLLALEPGHKLLDVSCGEGALVQFARAKGVKAYGIDFSRGAVVRACQITQQQGLLQGDGTSLPFPNQAFDYVTSIGSLEHYVSPQGGMHEIGRVLGKNGQACILLPNTYSLLGNVNYARKTGRIFDDGQPIQRYNTRAGWQEMLECSGLRVQRVEKWEITCPRTLADCVWYLRRPRKIAHLLTSLVIPANLASSLVYLCVKA